MVKIITWPLWGHPALYAPPSDLGGSGACQARSRSLMSGGGRRVEGVVGESTRVEGDYESRAMFWYEG